jgi:hypothetical protein
MTKGEGHAANATHYLITDKTKSISKEAIMFKKDELDIAKF